MLKSKIARVALAGGCALSLLAVTAPVALGAGGDNAGPAVNSGDAKLTAKAKLFTAVVGADGTIDRGRGAVSVSHTAGAGSYVVTFQRNVRECAYTATIGLPGDSGTSSRGFITVVGAAIDENAVFVTTDDTTGSASERGFHLTVIC